MDIGMHWHLDDPKTILDPLIRGMAAEIKLGKDEGIIYERLGAPEEKVNNFEFEIFDRSRTSLTGVIGDGAATGWADNSTTTDLPMTAAAVGILTVGHVLLVEDEQVVVSAVDRSANTIDVVSRGFATSTAASHADTTAFKVIGSAVNNTDLKNIESFAELSGKYKNYCQRFAETIDQEFDDELQARKAFEQKPQLIKEAMDRMFRKLATTTILGRKSLKTKSSPYSTSGLLQQLAEGGDARTALRYNASGVTSPESVLKNALLAVWAAGGNPTHIYLSPANKRKFDPLNEQFIRMGRGEAGVIGTDNGTAYMYQNTTLPFVQDKDLPDSRICIVTESMIRKGWRTGDILRGPNPEPRDSTLELRWSIYGSWFLEVKGVGVDHIDLYNVAI